MSLTLIDIQNVIASGRSHLAQRTKWALASPNKAWRKRRSLSVCRTRRVLKLRPIGTGASPVRGMETIMVNHPNRSKKAPIEPSTVLSDFARAAGHPARCLWEIPGPKNTAVVWLSCYALGQSTVIVETFDDGGWNAFTPTQSNRVDNTIADALNRCGVTERHATSGTSKITLTHEQNRAVYAALVAARSYNQRAIEEYKDRPVLLDRYTKDLADVEALIHLADRAWQPTDAPSTN